jgi:hypothetical protein
MPQSVPTIHSSAAGPKNPASAHLRAHNVNRDGELEKSEALVFPRVFLDAAIKMARQNNPDQRHATGASHRPAVINDRHVAMVIWIIVIPRMSYLDNPSPPVGLNR